MRVHVVVPEGIDDPRRPSGGNAYDRRVCAGLDALGWAVSTHPVEVGSLDRVLGGLPDAATVLVDGLVVPAGAQALVRERHRLRLVPLVHMIAANGTRAGEREVLSAAAAVITTSEWCRQQLLELHALPTQRVHVAEPGVDPAPLAPGTPTGGEFLCVGAVIAAKGHDVLVDALATLTGDWRCTCVGSLERDPAFVSQLRDRIRDRGLGDRLLLTGAVSRAELARSYHSADLLVHASHGETYGMVITEALAAGLPVIATDVGGVPEALGVSADGVRPGLLVAPGDPAELGGALQTWLQSTELRGRLRRVAAGRREDLAGWPATAQTVAGVLAEAAQ